MFLIASLIFLSAALADATATESDANMGEEGVAPASSQPAQSSTPIMDGFCHFRQIFLNDPITGEPLEERYLQVIIVNGEVDPPFAENGDDRVQERNEYYNTGHHKEYLNSNPGAVDIMATVRTERPNAEDDRVQLWEKVIVRVFNSNDPELATHYTDSQLWECMPGFQAVTQEDITFQDWQPLPVRQHGKILD